MYGAKNVYSSKDIVKKWEEKIDWVNIAKDTFDRELLSKLYKDL